MILKEPLKLIGEFSLTSTEAEWVRSMRDSGMSLEEIVNAWRAKVQDSPEAATLRVNYYLGKASAEELLEYFAQKSTPAS